MNNIDSTVKEVLIYLDSGVPDFWLTIDGGGYEGDFEKDYSIENCLEQDLIHSLQLHDINVKVGYHRSYDIELKKDFFTKILILTKD